MSEYTAVETPRGDRSREWELFVRERRDDPLRHVGSVSAPTADVAREQATQLFGWTAETLWLCPADETRRFNRDGVALPERASEDGDTRDADTADAGNSGGTDA